jgi:hypothetical protein
LPRQYAIKNGYLLSSCPNWATRRAAQMGNRPALYLSAGRRGLGIHKPLNGAISHYHEPIPNDGLRSRSSRHKRRRFAYS